MAPLICFTFTPLQYLINSLNQNVVKVYVSKKKKKEEVININLFNRFFFSIFFCLHLGINESIRHCVFSFYFLEEMTIVVFVIKNLKFFIAIII